MELSGSAARLSLCSLSPSRRRPPYRSQFEHKYIILKWATLSGGKQIHSEVNDPELSVHFYLLPSVCPFCFQTGIFVQRMIKCLEIVGVARDIKYLKY